MRLSIVTHETYVASIEWTPDGHGRSMLSGRGATPELARLDLASKIVVTLRDGVPDVAMIDELLRRAMERDA